MAVYSKETTEVVREQMEMIRAGRIRNHQLGNSAVTHSGELEKREQVAFYDFLPTKNCNFVCNLRGSELYE